MDDEVARLLHRALRWSMHDFSLANPSQAPVAPCASRYTECPVGWNGEQTRVAWRGLSGASVLKQDS